MVNTLVINLIGGPCSGKSTVATELFSRLKKMNVSCELSLEYIKDRIYEENMTIPTNQITIFGMEMYSLKTKLGKVDVIVHDGSLLNNILYNNETNIPFNNLIISEYNKFNNLDFFLDRGSIGFEEYGRIHTLQQSVELDKGIKKIYADCGATFISLDSRDAVDKMIPIIIERITVIKADTQDDK